MKITVVRSGGILGTPRRWEVRIEEQDDPQAWQELVTTLPWDERPPQYRAPDRYVYRITCAEHRVTIPEQALSGPWRDLVERVRDAASEP